MRLVETFEQPVMRIFRNAPSLPANAKEGLIKAWPYLALVFAVLQLLGALYSWTSLQVIAQLDYIHYLTPLDYAVVYLGAAMMVLEAILLFMAYPHLKRKAKYGWDLLFLGVLLYAFYSVLSLFMTNYGLLNFILGLFIVAVGFYLLVQIRDNYGGAKKEKAPKPEKKSKPSA